MAVLLGQPLSFPKKFTFFAIAATQQMHYTLND
jgi:hypothetical protein